MWTAIRAAALVGLLPLAAVAQTPTPGTCTLGVAESDLNVGDVTARLFNTGSLFYGGPHAAAYIVPAASGVSPIFAAGLWVGGMMGGELRMAGSTYGDFEFWPGPLDPGATLPNPGDCSSHDRIWSVSAADIAAYNSNGTTTPDLETWPIELGAEVIDGDGNPSNYNLPGGDRPRLYGSQTAFWVMNDVGNVHANTVTAPIGLEVRVHAFAIDDPSSPVLDRGTFYRYTLVNRNTVPLEDARVALFTDPDLGDASDDYVGTDVARSMFYVYNGDNNDTGGYGANPPAVGIDLLNGAQASMYFRNGAPVPTSDPSNGQEMYEVMRGRWTDGTSMTEGGYGLNPGSTSVTPFAFGGDPVAAGFWSMPCPNQPCGSPLPSGDLRAVGSSRFSLEPGGARTFDLAILYARGTSNLDSVTRLRAASDFVQGLYGAGTLFHPATNPPVGTAPAPAAATLSIRVAPNPLSGAAGVTFELPAAGVARVAVHDVLGREVAVLADGPAPAGRREVALDAGALAPGVYFVAVETAAGRAARTFTVVR